ncbi:TIGR02269 family lipoprotein [Archangium sp.]|uniref:SitA6 family polymorphic toxin lipoprotein n=1 Tax=Archangium sp. TaxID=1872627 RepID=UPI00286C21A7|nr:TIGR02269 family lipoprotein [Archangium sp.]
MSLVALLLAACAPASPSLRAWEDDDTTTCEDTGADECVVLACVPAFPRLEGKLIKHHLFPQAQEFRGWFNQNRINIHEWTMLVPEHAHLRIHRGANGGLWNAAWRQFMQANPGHVSREVMIRKAFELALRFDIAGPLMPYYAPVPPPGPQLLAP